MKSLTTASKLPPVYPSVKALGSHAPNSSVLSKGAGVPEAVLGIYRAIERGNSMRDIASVQCIAASIGPSCVLSSVPATLLTRRLHYVLGSHFIDTLIKQ